MNPEPREDLTTDDDLTGNRDRQSTITNPKSSDPEYTFRGQPLWPYTLGAQIVFNQAIGPKDKMMFAWAAFVFLLLQRGEKTAAADRNKHILPLWDDGTLRGAILDWADNLTESELMEARVIYKKWMKADADTSAEPVPTGNTRKAQKKTRLKTTALIIWLMRKEIGATRDEVLWEMPLPELNMMLHAYYHMEGGRHASRHVRKIPNLSFNASYHYSE
jgi:hypothetical protein